MELDASADPLDVGSRRALDREPPDAILVLATPEEVDHGLGHQLEAAIRVRARRDPGPTGAAAAYAGRSACSRDRRAAVSAREARSYRSFGP